MAAAITIKLKDDGTSASVNALDSVLRSSSIKSFLKTDASNWLARRAAARFDTGGDSASGHWAPLKASTIARKERAGAIDPWRPNVRSGKLNTAMGKENRGVKLYGAGGNTYMIWGAPGNSQDYKLQLTELGNKRTPPRKVLAVDTTDAEGILKLLGSFVIRNYKGFRTR